VEFARSATGNQGKRSPVPQIDDSELRATLESLCRGLRGFAELEAACKDRAFLRALESRLPPRARALLEEVAPAWLRLPSGRNAKVSYARNQTPWIASRLQDFFGWKDTPRIGGGTIPVVLHLLAPNHRPVQTTTDLAGFWERLYPSVRRELCRRYPKHAWPENPYTAWKNEEPRSKKK